MYCLTAATTVSTRLEPHLPADGRGHELVLAVQCQGPQAGVSFALPELDTATARPGRFVDLDVRVQRGQVLLGAGPETDTRACAAVSAAPGTSRWVTVRLATTGPPPTLVVVHAAPASAHFAIRQLRLGDDSAAGRAPAEDNGRRPTTLVWPPPTGAHLPNPAPDAATARVRMHQHGRAEETWA